MARVKKEAGKPTIAQALLLRSSPLTGRRGIVYMFLLSQDTDLAEIKPYLDDIGRSTRRS